MRQRQMKVESPKDSSLPKKDTQSKRDKVFLIFLCLCSFLLGTLSGKIIFSNQAEESNFPESKVSPQNIPQRVGINHNFLRILSDPLINPGEKKIEKEN